MVKRERGEMDEMGDRKCFERKETKELLRKNGSADRPRSSATSSAYRRAVRGP